MALALVVGSLTGAGWAGSGPLSTMVAPARALAGSDPSMAGTREVADGVGPAPAAPAAAPPSAASSPAAGRLGLRPGERAVALVAPAALPPVEPGDEVELVAVTVDDLGAVVAEPLATPGRVLAVGDDAVTVALPAADAVVALRHQAEGPVEVLLR